MDGVLLTRPDGSILRANPSACRALRLSEEEIVSRGRAGLVVPDEDLAARLRERSATGATSGTLRFRRGDDTTFVAEITSGIFPGQDTELHSYTIFRDATDRLRAEQELRESEERFRVAFHTSPDAVILNRLSDGVYVSANEGFTRLTGWTAEEVLGRSSAEIGIWADPADRDRLADLLQRHGFVENLEARFRRRDGSITPALLSARLLRLEGEELILSITRDIGEWRRGEDERKRLQAGLDHSARMSAIGQLAGGVAHDFNNLLTVVLSCVESLRIDAEAGAPTCMEDVDEIRGAAERARDLTRQLLTFARRQFIQPEVLDLNEVAQVSEKLLRRVLGEAISLRVTLAPELWPSRFDRGQMEQVIMNLALNARDAMPGGGTLTLETTNLAVRGGAVPDGAYVALRVADTGDRALRGGPGPPLRALLHHQGQGQGNRPGAGHRVRDREAEPRGDPGGERAGAGDHLPGPAPPLAGGARAGAPHRTRGRRRVATRRCSSWRTSRGFARSWRGPCGRPATASSSPPAAPRRSSSGPRPWSRRASW